MATRHDWAEIDLIRSLPALLAAPRDGGARAAAAEALAALNSQRTAAAVLAGRPLAVRADCLWVVGGDPADPVRLLIDGVRPEDAPGCDTCGEITGELDDLGGRWLCPGCAGEEVPW